MNIFVLDLDPKMAAQAQCNKHVSKMIVESTQLLSTAHPRGIAPYKHTHFNHPCGKWTRESIQNYEWLALHAFHLCEEYTLRYGKYHASEPHVLWCMENFPALPNIGQTPFARAIKEPFKTQTAGMGIVDAYRHYYVSDKVRFAKWQPRATAPHWWSNPE